MFNIELTENKLEEHKKKLHEIEMNMAALDMEENDFLEKLQVTPKQLSAYIGNKENFSEKEWKDLQQERNKLDEKLQRELENIRNPREQQKAYAERNIDHRWLFVK